MNIQLCSYSLAMPSCRCALTLKTNLAIEGSRYNARQKSRRWAVLSYCSFEALTNTTNLAIEGLQMWSRHEIGLEGTYLTYFPFSPIIERPQMHIILKTNLAIEGSRYNARQKSRRWAVLRCTAHCRDFLLAAVDTALSR